MESLKRDFPQEYRESPTLVAASENNTISRLLSKQHFRSVSLLTACNGLRRVRGGIMFESDLDKDARKMQRRTFLAVSATAVGAMALVSMLHTWNCRRRCGKCA